MPFVDSFILVMQHAPYGLNEPYCSLFQSGRELYYDNIWLKLRFTWLKENGALLLE